jgi:pimeloyl-ACP methyl ester carboxylesterase
MALTSVATSYARPFPSGARSATTMSAALVVDRMATPALIGAADDTERGQQLVERSSSGRPFRRPPGPVLAVGHSYGGAVITNAATTASNVVGLVFVAAFAPDEGELLGEVEANSKDSVLNPALVPRHYPTGEGDGTAVEFAIDPTKAREAFAGDLSADQAALIAATQRPVAEAAFSEPSGPPAWKRLPSWTVVATGDKAAGTDVVRAQAQRAGATITEVQGSHVIMVSQPQAVTDVILDALATVGAAAVA